MARKGGSYERKNGSLVLRERTGFVVDENGNAVPRQAPDAVATTTDSQAALIDTREETTDEDS